MFTESTCYTPVRLMTPHGGDQRALQPERQQAETPDMVEITPTPSLLYVLYVDQSSG